MPVTLDTIAIEFGAQWTGGGVINRIITDLARVARSTKDVTFDPVKNSNLAVGLNSQAQAYASAGAAALQYSAQISNIQKEMLKLGQSMAKTNAGTSGPTQGQIGQYQALATQLSEVQQQMLAVSNVGSKGATTLGGFVRALGPIAVVAGAVTGALYALGKGFSFLHDQAAQGAAIRQTAESFKFMTTNMANVPNLLNQMREASRGTISDFQLMSSYLTLVAGATPELADSLSAATPRILEIAKAASVLNPTLGDTTFFFESLARGIKRTEYRLIDNLGLNVRVGEANRRYAESLGKTVLELTAMERQQAFLNEVLRVGDSLINQVGGNVDSLTDPYQKYATNIENVKNGLREMVSVSFAPAIESLANFTGGMAEAFEKAQLTYDILRQIIALEFDGLDYQIDTRTYSEGVSGARAYGNAILTLIGQMGKISTFDIKSKELVRGQIEGTIANAIGPIENMAIAQSTVMAGMRKMFGGAVEFNNVGADVYANITSGAQTFQVELRSILELTEQLNEAQRQSELNERGGSWFVNQGLDSSQLRQVEEAFAAWKRKLDVQDKLVEMGNNVDAVGKKSGYAAGKVQAMADAMAQLNDVARKNRGPSPEYMEKWAELIDAERDLAAETTAAWREIAQQRTANTASAWADIFSGGDIDTDLVVGDLKNLGEAWITVGGATGEQADKIAELRGEMKKAQEEVWDLTHGIGVQGDDAEKTAKKIDELNAEIANYGVVISQLEGEVGPTSQKKVNFGLDLDDINVYERFVDILGEIGGTAPQLGALAQELGLIGPETAMAMEKVAALDTWLKDLALGVSVGDITIENAGEAGRRIIEMLESEMSVQELVVQVKADIAGAKQQAISDWRTDRHDPDFQGELDIYANVDPATQAVAQAVGIIQGTGNEMTVDANTDPARQKVMELKTELEAMTITVDIQGKYTPPPNMPQTSTVSTPHSGNQEYATGGYVAYSRGRKVPAFVHGGEYVLKPDAVDRLGVGFLDALNKGSIPANYNNQVTMQNNFYGSVGGGEARQVIIKSSGDAANELVEVLKREGYSI